MKIFGEDLGALGRWYIAMPPLLLVGFLVGLFFLALAGQTRLEAGNLRVQNSQLREQSLAEFVAMVSAAETAQRGYLLTGQDAYLKQYSAAVARVIPALDRVHDAYGSADSQAAITGRLRELTGQKLAELNGALADSKNRGAEPAVAVRGIDLGQQTMDEIVSVAGMLQSRESVELSAAADRWRSDLLWSRAFTAAGAVLNIGLVLLAMRLVYGDMRRRAQQATDLRDQKQELERQVAERTRDLTALSTHLQEVSEQEKSALSRELHDELGGLLVAARMDLSWLQQRLPTSNPAIEQRFKRIHESLSAGVDLKRRVVEELRPTLLDNMGLFAALRWQFKETCRRSGLECTETMPETEPKFDPVASIGIFRVGQEALTNILKHAGAKSADLLVKITDDSFVLRIADDGRGIAANRLRISASHGLASMRHRVNALGGTWHLTSPDSGGTVVTVVIPLPKVIAAQAEPALASLDHLP
jgi:signal transduction histidine kinase